MLKNVTNYERSNRQGSENATIFPKQNYCEQHKEKRIANEFNNFFIDIGPELAQEIPRPTSSFKSYVPKSNSTSDQLVLMN